MKKLALLLGALCVLCSSPAAIAQSDDEAAAIARFRNALREAPLVPKDAPEGFDVTIVEFFDYQCGYCKKQHIAFQQLAKSDPRVRIVYRDWPIFGGESNFAARAALASQFQGRHDAFHDALMRHPGKLDRAGIKAAARQAGVDWERLTADIAKHESKIEAVLAQSDRQARILGLQGTPGLVIGDFLVPGALDLDALRDAVAEARSAS
ncbi:DsbA family protein [Altericroceibacterium spongiae]|uniref:DsbA family protein n=1 Tax=Altericroceibacterium spongiae TaxID=2320269 RepID=A0A420EPH7_9SPHN|nr:DsbA family protein [Altericroceibacterium spongiae]RKF22585.1 DsbA family protein [Altericroceibacterium spongiae]